MKKIILLSPFVFIFAGVYLLSPPWALVVLGAMVWLDNNMPFGGPPPIVKK